MDKHGFRNIKKKLKMTNEKISETMDVDLFQVQQWESGIWGIPRSMQKFLRTLLSGQRDMEAVYMSGFQRGHIGGRKEGRLEAVEGYTKGYDDGYKKGLNDRESYRDGYADAMRDMGVAE